MGTKSNISVDNSNTSRIDYPCILGISPCFSLKIYGSHHLLHHHAQDNTLLHSLHLILLEEVSLILEPKCV